MYCGWFGSEEADEPSQQCDGDFPLRSKEMRAGERARHRQREREKEGEGLDKRNWKKKNNICNFQMECLPSSAKSQRRRLAHIKVRWVDSEAEELPEPILGSVAFNLHQII